MSRTKDDGLSYFPLDVGYFKDERIRRLAGRFGSDGPLFYIYVLCRIYENGYVIVMNDDFTEDAALDVHCSTEKIGLMLEYLLSRSLLKALPVDTSLGTVTYLTSHGIQAQYQKSARGKKRDIEVDDTLWILNSSETEGFIKVCPSENKSRKKDDNSGEKAINPGNKPQSKVKEKKVKESKVKRIDPPSRDEVRAYARSRGSSVDPDRFYDYFSEGNWIDSKGNPVLNWKQKFITWEKHRGVSGDGTFPAAKTTTFYDIAEQIKGGELNDI